MPPLQPRARIDNSNSVDITYPEFDLRPRYVVRLETVQLVIPATEVGVAIHATWYATSTSRSGVSEGDFELKVSEAASASQVMLAKREDDKSDLEDD